MSDSHLVGIWLVGICWVTILIMIDAAQNRRMKWKKENKSKVEGGEGLDESPEPPTQWSEVFISSSHFLWESRATNPKILEATLYSLITTSFETRRSFLGKYLFSTSQTGEEAFWEDAHLQFFNFIKIRITQLRWGRRHAAETLSWTKRAGASFSCPDLPVNNNDR